MYLKLCAKLLFKAFKAFLALILLKLVQIRFVWQTWRKTLFGNIIHTFSSQIQFSLDAFLKKFDSYGFCIEMVRIENNSHMFEIT